MTHFIKHCILKFSYNCYKSYKEQLIHHTVMFVYMYIYITHITCIIPDITVIYMYISLHMYTLYNIYHCDIIELHK